MHTMKRTFTALGGVAIAAAILLHAAAGRAQDAATRGWVVHLDEAGKPSVPETPGPAAVERQDEPAAAAAPMPPVQPAPGGGDMIRLDDRFNHNTVAHRAGEHVRVGCERAAPLP